ncbi:MAG: thiamine-phosphate kinase [Opitutales bacterium]|nr:thiamine-phosphate kinase [Opitutales bacterium]
MFINHQSADNPHLNEVNLLKCIRQWLGSTAPPSPQGMGDDCAVITPANGLKQIITTDTLTYGIHFDATVSAHDAGAKLIKRNLSDIAAMGGTPSHAVLALLCGPDISIDWLEAFFAGIRQTCEQFTLSIVGGDISTLPAGQFSSALTVVGTAKKPRLRSGANVGDAIYVTGQLGGSILKKHYAFLPRLDEGRWLAARPECRAMLDITDGIAKDLQAIMPDNSSAQLDLKNIPVSKDAETLAISTGKEPMEHAFCDGEDYELLFAVDGKAANADFEAQWQADFPQVKLSKIGQFIEAVDTGIYIDSSTNEPLPWIHGYRHLVPE